MKLLDHLALRAFGGSAKALVMSLVAGGRLTKEEMAEVKKLIAARQ